MVVRQSKSLLTIIKFYIKLNINILFSRSRKAGGKRGCSYYAKAATSFKFAIIRFGIDV